jgi:hypothetical protein
VSRCSGIKSLKFVIVSHLAFSNHQSSNNLITIIHRPEPSQLHPILQPLYPLWSSGQSRISVSSLDLSDISTQALKGSQRQFIEALNLSPQIVLFVVGTGLLGQGCDSCEESEVYNGGSRVVVGGGKCERELCKIGGIVVGQTSL